MIRQTLVLSLLLTSIARASGAPEPNHDATTDRATPTERSNRQRDEAQSQSHSVCVGSREAGKTLRAELRERMVLSPDGTIVVLPCADVKGNWWPLRRRMGRSHFERLHKGTPI